MIYDIIFVGLARNCAASAPNFLKLLDDLHSVHGMSCLAVVGENGSTDDTRKALEHELIEIVDTSFMADIKGRLARMAKGREKVAEAARRHQARVFAVIDLDNTISSPLEAKQFADAIRKLDGDDFFAVSSQSKPYYYDLFAYEDYGKSYQDLPSRIGAAKKSLNPILYYRLFRDVIYPAQRNLSSTAFLSCISAFNGLCIYPEKYFRLGTYVAGANLDICEHINFNRSIHTATGRLMQISPELTVCMPPEHGPSNAIGFLVRRILKLMHRG